MQTTMRAHEPVTVSRSNIGLLLAVIAGIVCLAVSIWPSPAPEGQTGNPWFPLTPVCALMFLGGAALADRHMWLGKALLLVGGLALTISGIVMRVISIGGPFDFWGAIAAIGPGLVAIVAGLLIGRINRTAIP
jgi:peptidoglycan/LPS O-acetylase OafA/YrhL